MQVPVAFIAMSSGCGVDGFGRFGGVGAVRVVLMQQLRLAERERAETGQAGQPGKVDGERVWGVASRLTASSRPVRACSSHVTTASMAGTSPYARYGWWGS